MSSQDQPFVREGALQQPVEAVDSRAVFGQVMGLVAVTVGFFALGAYLGRDLTGGGIFALFIAAFACVFGANIAAQRRIEWLAITLLFGDGMFIGPPGGPVVGVYGEADPAIPWGGRGRS